MLGRLPIRRDSAFDNADLRDIHMIAPYVQKLQIMDAFSSNRLLQLTRAHNRQMVRDILDSTRLLGGRSRDQLAKLSIRVEKLYTLL